MSNLGLIFAISGPVFDKKFNEIFTGHSAFLPENVPDILKTLPVPNPYPYPEQKPYPYPRVPAGIPDGYGYTRYPQVFSGNTSGQFITRNDIRWSPWNNKYPSTRT